MKETAPAEKPTDNLLVAAAKAIGKAAGTVAASVGHHEAVSPEARLAPKAVAKGKLPDRNKTRLPRRKKKALQKAKVHA